MRYWFIAFTFLFFSCLFACQQSNNAAVSPEDLGQHTYKRYCITCHGINGQLQLNGAKNFKESVLNLEERIAVITNGRNLMTPFKDILTAEEIEAVATYTLQFSKGE